MNFIFIGSAIAFTGLFLLERIIPLRHETHTLRKRLLVNACVTLLAFVMNSLTVLPSSLFALNQAEKWHFGLVHLLGLPNWAGNFIAFLLLDLTYYYWHRANHRFSVLWRFHNVHHIDPDMDVSTGFRFHFIEILFSTAFRVAQVGLIGASFFAFAAYELVFQLNTLFHHSNVKLPLWWERSLNGILVTPRMHGIHHSQVQQETNANFSVIFPWWDRLHKTLRLNIPQAAIAIGVPAYTQPEDNALVSVLLMPFRPQRDYWHDSHQSTVERDPQVLGDDPTRMVDWDAVNAQSSNQESSAQQQSCS
ncbi:MAG: sterol desaturase family protein [Leptolyngbya sp. BL-A-14]